jgi:tetratricopeptide (TPR) repeat protein
MRLSIAALSFVVFGSALTGCASTGTAAPAASEAGASAADKMDYVTAIKRVSYWGPITAGGMAFIEKAGRPTVNETAVTVSLKRGGAYYCRYQDTPNPVVARRFLAQPPTSVSINCRGASLSVWNSEAQSQKFVAAWRTMAGGVPTDSPEKAAVFEAAAEKYRADPAAFVIPEEARVFKVQAETAVREKRLWDAVDRFGKALDISPAWAVGRFNLALIYGELGFPGLAIPEMNKYLKLAPDAKNARAAQDKIYAWRDKIQH